MVSVIAFNFLQMDIHHVQEISNQKGIMYCNKDIVTIQVWVPHCPVMTAIRSNILSMTKSLDGTMYKRKIGRHIHEL